MSITKDFEKYGYRDLPPSERYYPAVQTEELLAHARALEKMLKKHEWSDEEIWCPECGARKESGHSSNCELARLLK